MQILCPNCREALTLPHELLRKGVARTACPSCNFPFVARLGTPATDGSARRDPTLPIYLEGVTSSAANVEAAGEIGVKLPAMMPADTRTRVVLDDSLKLEIESVRGRRGDPSTPGWIAATTATMQPTTPSPSLLAETTDVRGDPTDPAVLPLDKLATDVSSHPDTLGPVEASPAPESAEYEALNPVRPLADRTKAVSATLTEPAGLSPSAARPLQLSPTAPAAGQVDPRSTTMRFPPGMDTSAPPDSLAPPPLSDPRAGSVARGIGLVVSVVVFGSIVFGLFVLSRNDWSLDPSRLDIMLDRALHGTSDPLPRELANLETSQPIVDLTKLADDRPVVTAEGVVKNTGSTVRRFIYLRAEIRQRDRVIASAEAPAGNLFRRAELGRLTKTTLASLINPAGRQGRNAKVEPGESVAYMVVFTDLPAGFVLAEHEVVARVSKAELNEGP